MAAVESILSELSEHALNPGLAVKQAKDEGKAVIGCVPYYVPLELVHAAGMHPVELWGGGSLSGSGGSYYPAFYCSVLFTLMERALDGTYDDLDGVIIPTTCDGLRNLEENWKFARPDMEVIDFVQPAALYSPESHTYLVWQLHQMAKRLEEIGNTHITERAMRESLNTYNRQRQAMREFSAVAAQHLDVITPTVRQSVFAATRSMDVKRHTALVEQLNALLAEQPVYDFKGTKVVVTGILVDLIPLLEELEKNNIAVVGDHTVAESARYFEDVPGKVDPFDSFAALWENVKGVSVRLDPRKERGEILAKLVKERDADGVVACIVKFCEPEEYDVPIMQQQLDAHDIPLLVLEVESQDTASEQIATRIQAFAEMVRLR